MDWFLEHAYVIPLIPAASFFLILLFGKRLPYKGAEIGIAALGVCFALALATNVQWREYVNDSEHAEEAVHDAEEGAVGGEEAVEGEARGAEGESAESAEAGEAHEEFEVVPFEKSGRGGRTAASSSPPACSSTAPP